MAPTTGYAAGFAAEDTEISYAIESVWATLPSVAFKALRYTSVNMRGQKRRGRPQEIRADRQAAAAVTLSEEAGGQIGFGFSYGAYDDLLAGLLGNDWAAGPAITSSTVSVAAFNRIETTTPGLFAGIEPGQFVRLAGFSNATNNQVVLVFDNVGDTILWVIAPTPLVVESAAAGHQVLSSGTLRNGNQFQSFFLQRRFGSTMFLRYPGCFPRSASLQAQTGQFLNGTFDLLAQDETKSITNASTGSVIAAPTGRVHDPVGGVVGFIANTAVQPRCTRFGLNIANEGAAGQYALGSAKAQGVLPGVFTLSGSCELFFADFALYDMFRAETPDVMGFITRSALGTYGIGLPHTNLMNPQITAGGPGQPVMATFDIEGNPHPTLGYTLRIDRIAA
ncbi:phage tail tube protein [Rhodovarius lipocyclicus]|uniref:phage tail tube protein n=1 Tax=Rhodovarius lipocyclicus TaxID=268410 RepID=UPI00135B4784|nr:phage tail tube protein [Rhodovarius lipocyclicus]